MFLGAFSPLGQERGRLPKTYSSPKCIFVLNLVALSKKYGHACEVTNWIPSADMPKFCRFVPRQSHMQYFQTTARNIIPRRCRENCVYGSSRAIGIRCKTRLVNTIEFYF